MQKSHTVSSKTVKAQTKRKKQAIKKNSVGGMDTSFLLLVLILLAFGLIMVFSASYANALYYRGDSFAYISKQALFAVLGVAAMLVISKIDYRVYQKYAVPILVLGFVFLIIVILPLPISEPLNNAKRWINLGFTNFQPSEYMKFAVVISFAALICKNYSKMSTFRFGVLPFAILLGAIATLMMMQPHLSGTILIAGIGLTMMFVGGTKLRYFLIIIACGGAGVVGIVALKGVDYIMHRIDGWIHPFADIQDNTWQTVQSLIAIGSGGVMGLGLGNSRQKYLYLPEPQNDFIFAIVCEELGFIGAVLVIILFILLVYRGFAIANKAPDKFSAMVVIGITVQIGLQALLNIGVVTNSIPNTGISLPFFSYGGTALMMQLAEVGIILNISRHANIEKV